MYLLQDHNKEVIFTSCIFFATPHLRVNSLDGATGDLNVFHLIIKISWSLNLQIKSNNINYCVIANIKSFFALSTDDKVYFESKNNCNSASFQKSLIRKNIMILKTSQQSFKYYWNKTLTCFLCEQIGHSKGSYIYFCFNPDLRRLITGASRRLEPVIKCCSFLSFFQCLVSRAPLSAVTESLS